MKKRKIEIIVDGLVQGVGFRFFVYNEAIKLGLKGYTKNLMNGEVITVSEGDEFLLEELMNKIKIGPRSAHVSRCSFTWSDYKNEFNKFEIK